MPHSLDKSPGGPVPRQGSFVYSLNITAKHPLETQGLLSVLLTLFICINRMDCPLGTGSSFFWVEKKQLLVCGLSDLDVGTRSELREESFVLFFLYWLDCLQRKRAGHEGVLKAKRRLKNAKALGCYSSNFWLEPAVNEGTRGEYYRLIFRHNCIYPSRPHLQPSLLGLWWTTVALRKPFPFTSDFQTCPLELTGLDSLCCSPLVLRACLRDLSIVCFQNQDFCHLSRKSF